MVSKYILIISCDRSGGKALMFSLSDKLKIPWIDWMFNPQPHHPGYDQMKDGKVWIERPNVPCVQHTILSEHQELINNTPHFNSKTILEYSKGFTDIILLDRRDIKEQISSYEHGLSSEHPYYQMREDFPKNAQPHPSGIYKWYEDVEKRSQRWRQMFIDMKKCIHFISTKLNIPIHYYEDLFGNKQYRKEHLGQKGLPYNNDWFNPNRRLRDGEQWWSNEQSKIVKQT